jgi:hypothetical protein
MDRKKPREYILCAAIWYKDFPKGSWQPTNLDRGLVVCGRRHGNCIDVVFLLTGKRTVQFGKDSTGENVQGFITNRNRFLTRSEASKLFKENGGEPQYGDDLYSEDLY